MGKCGRNGYWEAEIMPKIWDSGVYGLVYHGRDVDLASKVNYATADTRIVIFRKSGGYCLSLIY